MPGQQTPNLRIGELRKLVEELIALKPQSSVPSSRHILELIHELEVQQVKLENQIGELQRSQQEISVQRKKYEDLYEFAPCGYVTLSGEGIITQANLTAVNLLSPARSHLFKSALSHFISVPYQDAFFAARKKVIETKSKQSCELQLLHQSGKDETWVLAEMEADFANDDSVVQWRIALSDITKKVLVEEDFRQAEKMNIIRMLAGGVAHDLNNILSGLTTYPEFLLLDLPEDSHLREPLETIIASGRKATAVVSDMQTLSRGVTDRKESVSLNGLVQRNLDSLEFRQLTDDNGKVKVVTNLESRPLYVYCSPIHIQKLIMNLVINGVEAMGKGGTLTISTSVRIREVDDIGKAGGKQDCCVLEISDTGDCISPDDIEHIFDPFYTRKAMGKSGTGLGLTIVQNVVQSHNGTINVKSDSSGTTFTVYLPLGFEPAGTAVDDETGRDFSGTEYILVVDDEPLQRNLNRKLLSSLGYKVETAASGEEALLYLEENKVDILILDMLMHPGMSGLETYVRAIEHVPDQKAIIVSGFAPDKSIREAIDLGLKGFLAKPYSISDLAKIVRQALDS